MPRDGVLREGITGTEQAGRDSLCCPGSQGTLVNKTRSSQARKWKPEMEEAVAAWQGPCGTDLGLELKEDSLEQ